VVPGLFSPFEHDIIFGSHLALSSFDLGHAEMQTEYDMSVK
jgi:hypothetical protein